MAQTTCAHQNHFYKAVMDANQLPGPAIINVFTTCQPEHGVGDNMAEHQAKLAADSRSFPVFIYDPRKGKRFKERLSLVGNPNVKEDWYVHPKTGEPVDFIAFAAAKAVSPSISTRTEIPRPRSSPRNRNGWKTGTCWRSWPASNNDFPLQNSRGLVTEPRPQGVVLRQGD